MKNLFEAIEKKINERDKLEKQLKENKYPKAIYKSKLKQLNDINLFFKKYGNIY